jgi:hypothetical protein
MDLLGSDSSNIVKFLLGKVLFGGSISFNGPKFINGQFSTTPLRVTFPRDNSRALLGRGVRRASARTSEVQGAVSPSIARRRRRASPASPARGSLARARQRETVAVVARCVVSSSSAPPIPLLRQRRRWRQRPRVSGHATARPWHATARHRAPAVRHRAPAAHHRAPPWQNN